MARLLRNRNIANSIWNVIDIFFYPVLFLVSTPFFISWLGKEQFGAWMLINTVMVSMQAFNFGIGNNVLVAVAQHEGNNDLQGKANVLNYSLSITMLLFAISVSAGIVLACLIQYQGLFHISEAYKTITAEGILLAGVTVGFRFFEQVFTFYFKALEQFKTATALSSGNRITALLINMMILKLFNGNVVHLFLVIIIVNVLFMLFAVMLLRTDLHGFKFRFSIKLPRREVNYAFFTWLQSLTILITFQTDRYLVVDHFGLSVMGYYALAATIFTYMHMGFNAVFPWLIPKFAKLQANNSESEHLYLAARNIVAAGTVIILLVFYFIYPFVFNLMMGKGTQQELHNYVRSFIALDALFVLSIVPSYYLNALGYERKLLSFYVTLAVCSATGMVLFLKVFPLPGSVIYGLIAGCAIAIIFLYVRMEYIIRSHFSITSFIASVLPAIMLAAFILQTDKWMGWILLGLLIITFYQLLVKGNVHKLKILLYS